MGCSGNSQTAHAAGSHALTITFTLGALPTAPAGYTFCASEGLVCSVTGTKEVQYGADGKYRNKMGATGPVTCNSATFGGDPPMGSTRTATSSTSQTPGLPPTRRSTDHRIGRDSLNGPPRG
jgi:hypothetical protein